MAKVFISHRKSDLEKAKQLAKELITAGHKVWLDYWEIQGGDSIIQKISDGLKDAEYLLLCLSSKGVNSQWISREWMSALASQLSGKNIKLIPVRLSGEEQPFIISDIKYIDLISNWSKGISDLLKSIK